MKQFSITFKIETIKFVKEYCLLRLKILINVLNRNIDVTIQIFLENVTKFDLTFLCYLVTIKSKLIFTYCIDLYGSQQYNYDTWYPEPFYVTWRKGKKFNLEVTISYTL